MASKDFSIKLLISGCLPFLFLDRHLSVSFDRIYFLIKKSILPKGIALFFQELCAREETFNGLYLFKNHQ